MKVFRIGIPGSGFIGALGLLGFLALSLTCRSQPLGSALCAAAEPSADGPIASPEPVWPQADDAWAHPVLLHGRLYLRYHDARWCYDVRAADGSSGD